MANNSDYENAINAVRSGNANSHQRHLVDRAANQAGDQGNRAREAREESGKSRGHWLC